METHHKETDHGTYVIEPLFDSHAQYLEQRDDEYESKWEIFAPEGRNFDTCHSYLEVSYRDCLSHVGMAGGLCSDPTDCCGCEDCGCKVCREYYEEE